MDDRNSGLASLTFETTDPTADPAWEDLSRAHGSVFSSPPWLTALTAAYDIHVEALVTKASDSSLTGGLAVAKLGTAQWRRFSALPFSDYAGPIDVTGDAGPIIGNHLFEEGLPFEVRCLAGNPCLEDARLNETQPPDLWHGVALDADEDRAWSCLPGSARRAIRKARDSDVEIRVSHDTETLRMFYELHLRTRKEKHALLAQPFGFFTGLQNSFGDDMAVLGAWKDGVLVAGILLLIWADTLYYKFNASLPSMLEVRPNDLLMWEATRLGVTRGLRTLDLGRTDAGHDSLARYKSKYATGTSRIHTMSYGDYRKDPVIGEILGPMTKLLTSPNVPDHLTEQAGNLFYRYFA